MSELEATPPKQKGLIQDSNQLRNSMASCLFRSAGNAVAFNGQIAARFMSTSGNVKVRDRYHYLPSAQYILNSRRFFLLMSNSHISLQDMGGAFKDRESAAENAVCIELES